MTVGLFRVWLDPHEHIDADRFAEWRKTAFSDIPGVSSVDILTDPDTNSNKSYRYENAYRLNNIEALDKETIDSLREASRSIIKRSDWQLYTQISHDKRDDRGERLSGIVFVSVGMSPIETPDLLADYHDWYKEEHMPILYEVPGWRTGSRYRRIGSFGDNVEVGSPYLAVHQYNQDNGLGKDQWRKSVESPWTKRVMSNLSAPNDRRVLRLEA